MHLLLKHTDRKRFCHSITNILLLRLTVSALGIKLNDYWNALTDKQSRGRALQAGGRGESQAESASEK